MPKKMVHFSYHDNFEFLHAPGIPSSKNVFLSKSACISYLESIVIDNMLCANFLGASAGRKHRFFTTEVGSWILRSKEIIYIQAFDYKSRARDESEWRSKLPRVNFPVNNSTGYNINRRI